MDFEISAAYIDTPENTEGKFPTPRALTFCPFGVLSLTPRGVTRIGSARVSKTPA